MIRTQVQLTEEQSRRLKEMAAQRGVSVAELVRESVERLLAERERQDEEKWERVRSIIGKYRDSATDVSVNHDSYLDEAYLS